MQEIENLRYYLHDNFLTSEQFKILTQEDAYMENKTCELKLGTGLKESGSILLSYDNPIFNPKYGELLVKLRLTSKDDVVAYWGFKQNLTEPTETMIESHAGFLLINGKLYATTGNGSNQQKVQIQGLDLTKFYEYKIVYNKFYLAPLPEVLTYLGTPIIKKVPYEFRLLQTNSTYPPKDQVHYLVFFIKNTTATEKLLYLTKLIYKEKYPT